MKHRGKYFLSRKESFPMQADINMDNNFLQNVATLTTSHQGANKGYCDYNFLNRQKGGQIMGSLSMNQNDLFEIPAPKYGSSAVNKNYVDAKIPSVDSTQFVKKAGDRMGGDLDMDANFIKNVGINLSDDSTVVPRSYVDSFATSAIHSPLERDLYASNFQIKQLKNPTDVQDAINKKYFDEELLKSHLVSSHIENAFKYLLDQDESSSERNIIVNGIADFNGSPHKNKKAYYIDLVYTTGTQNYNSKIGINLYPLPIGKYTVIMEYYFPEDINISLVAGSTTAVIKQQTTTNFTDFKNHLVQFDQKSKDIPDYLFFNIRGSGTTSTNPEGYLVFYGVKEWVDVVPPQIYDRDLETGMFEYENELMKMNMDLNLNGFSVVNAKEDFFSLRGYYNSSDPKYPRTVNFVPGLLGLTVIIFNSFLFEIYVAITSVAPGNDYRFDLGIGQIGDSRQNFHVTSNGLTKFYKFTEFQKNFYPRLEIIGSKISYAGNPKIPPNFSTAKVVLRFLRVD